jgi:serine/threonine-protein kinase
VHTRILFGVAAWVLGAGTATAGSLLAVSLLGQGITGGSGQLLTQDAVNRALASEAAEASPPAPPSVTASATPSRARAAATPSPVVATAPPGPAPATTPPATTAPAPSMTTVPPAPAGGTVLTSPGGEVVAACQAGGAYLVSWSPLQGYEIGDVARGPAATARVTFESAATRVTMAVSCSAGVPSATSYTRSGGDE